MALISNAADRELDPLQSVLAHLPHGAYGLYEGLCNFLWNDSLVPVEVKEGLRFLSAVKIGCAYCRTVRGQIHGVRRLLSDDFYEAVAQGKSDWDKFWDPEWVPIFEMAVATLESGLIPPPLVESAKRHLSEPQIVEAIFFMLVIGASHRFSLAFGVEESCPVPARGI